MITVNMPWWDKDGTEYTSVLIGKYDLETDGFDYEESFYDSMEKMYGEWLRENKVEFTFTVSLKPNYTDYTLNPAIRFENDDEAMAFRLRWL